MDSLQNAPLLPPPTPSELASLAEQARAFRAAMLEQSPQVPAKPRRLRRRLTPKTVCTLAERYRNGESSTALGREYGVSKSGLIQLLRSEGVVLRNQSISPEAIDTARWLYASGFSIRQVLKEAGCSFGTGRRVLHNAGALIKEK